MKACSWEVASWVALFLHTHTCPTLAVISLMLLHTYKVDVVLKVLLHLVLPICVLKYIIQPILRRGVGKIESFLHMSIHYSTHSKTPEIIFKIKMQVVDRGYLWKLFVAKNICKSISKSYLRLCSKYKLSKLTEK